MGVAADLPVCRPADAAEAGDLVRRGAVYIDGYPGGPKPGVRLDTSSLTGVVDYPARDLTVTVRAGTQRAELTRVLAAENQRLPVDIGPGTVGAAVAANHFGPRRLGYGTIRDYLIGCRFLTPAGEEANAGGRVVKNVAGYDLMKLHTGALGTLGLLTELTFKVVPKPEDAVIVLFGLNPAAVGPTLDRLHASATRPAAVEVLNRAAAESRKLPVIEPWVVAVGFEGPAVRVRWQADTLLAELAAAPVREVSAARGETAGPLWDALAGRPAGGLAFVGAVRPGRLADWLMTPALADCRVSAGGLVGNVTVESPLTAAAEAATQLTALRTAAGDGHLSVSRRPAGWETWKPPAAPRPDHALIRAVKAALDPDDLFNPGRLAFDA